MKTSILTAILALLASSATTHAATALAIADARNAALWFLAVLCYFGLVWRSR